MEPRLLLIVAGRRAMGHLRTARVLAIALLSVATCGCQDAPRPRLTAKPADPDGNFELLVHIEGSVRDTVDVRAELDGELVISDYFPGADMHRYRRYPLRLRNGRHWIRIWSEYSDTEMIRRFFVMGQDVGVITYLCNPGSDRNLMESGFKFRVLWGPLLIM